MTAINFCQHVTQQASECRLRHRILDSVKAIIKIIIHAVFRSVPIETGVNIFENFSEERIIFREFFLRILCIGRKGFVRGGASRKKKKEQQ